MKLILVFVLGIISYNTIQVCDASNDFTLKLVYVFFRHGSRYPSNQELYRNDRYADILKLAGLGQLTEDGKQNSCKLGTLLKTRYHTLVGSVYNPDFVIAQSSGMERTNATADLVLNGIFSQCGQDSKTTVSLTNYKIVVKDYELKLVQTYCPAYREELNRILESPECQQLLKENDQLLQYVLENSGTACKSLLEICFLYSGLTCEKVANLPIPEWAEQVYPYLQNLAVMQVKYESGNDLLKRLNGGRMLQKVLDGMTGLIENPTKSGSVKMVLYSCHDFNMAATLSTLNVFQPHFPLFNSAIAIELYYHTKENQHYIKVVYIKDINLEPVELSITNCSSMCEFYEFKKIMDVYLPVNYTKECNSDIPLD